MCVYVGEIEGRIRERDNDSPVSIILLLLIYLARSPSFFLFLSLYLPTLSTHHRRHSLLPRYRSGGGGIVLPFLFSSVTASRRGCMDFFVSCIITMVTNYYYYYYSYYCYLLVSFCNWYYSWKSGVGGGRRRIHSYAGRG